MLEAITSAIKDTSASDDQLKSRIDSIDIARTWTWPYADLPGLLSERLDLSARPTWTRYTETHGGNQPAKLVDEAAGRIARGESTVAIVTGGEALASCELAPQKRSGEKREEGREASSPSAQSWPASQPASTLSIIADRPFLLGTKKVTACAKAGSPEPPGWTRPEVPVHDVFSPSTADLGEGTYIPIPAYLPSRRIPPTEEKSSEKKRASIPSDDPRCRCAAHAQRHWRYAFHRSPDPGVPPVRDGLPCTSWTDGPGEQRRVGCAVRRICQDRRSEPARLELWAGPCRQGRDPNRVPQKQDDLLPL